MGIDIYASWIGITDEERNAQFTGFDSLAGRTGYLREAYHGAPYATRVLLPEAFAYQEHEYGPQIAAATLRGRLPQTVLAVLYRNARIYNDGAARKLLCGLGVEPAAPPPQHRDIGDTLTAVITEAATVNETEFTPTLEEFRDASVIERLRVDPTVNSFVEFVELCEQKERDTGEPCRICASY